MKYVTDIVAIRKIKRKASYHKEKTEGFFDNVFKTKNQKQGSSISKILRNNKKVSVVFAMCLMVLFVLNSFSSVKAASYSFSSKQISDGIYNYSNINIPNPGTVSLQAGDLGSWQGDNGLKQPPVNSYGDGEIIYGPNQTIYYMTHLQGCRFLRYEIETQIWSDLAEPVVSCMDGMALTFDGISTFYLLAGGSTQSFQKYDIITDSWTKITDIPMAVGGVSKSAFVNYQGYKYVYAFRGLTSTSMWRYVVASGTWEQKNSINATVDWWGLTMSWDKGNYIYAISHGHNQFRKYSIATDTWSDLATPPASPSRRHVLLPISSGTVLMFSLELWGSGNPESTFLKKYDVISNTWSDMSLPPSGQVYDFAPIATYDGVDSVYAVMGNDIRPVFYKYTISTDSWNQTDNLFVRSNNFYHWKPMYDGNRTFYYVGGIYSSYLDKVYKYDMDTKQATQIGFYPQNGPKTGIAGTYYNNALYLIPYHGNKAFFKFDLSTNDWVVLPELPFASTYGMDLIDGGDGYIYATMGRADFYRYSEAGGWQQRASMPYGINHGGGITKVGNYLYAMIGSYTSYFVRYDIAANAWTTLENIPVGSISYGGSITSNGSQYIYVTPSSRTPATSEYFYRYDTNTSVWKRMANLPASVNVVAFSFYDTVNDFLYLAPAISENFLWKWNPTSGNFVTSGNWYSKTLDLTQVQAWTGLQATIGGTGSVIFNTRTSDNGKIWSDWQQVSGSTIASSPKRFLQVKATLSGDANTAPTFSNLAINYTQESSPPTLPSQLTARGNVNGEVLTTGQTYEYQHPYFEWSGSSDGANGSGVDGYYVYFGTDSSADPEVSGSYQRTSNYTVSMAMTSGEIYYFRLKVKDKLGNISDAATYFSYRYWFISPPGTYLATNQEDFGMGTNYELDLTSESGKMKLKNLTNGSWSNGPFTSLPDTSSGGAMKVIGDFLYIARGSSTTTFWRLNLETNVWDTLATIPGAVGTGSAMDWDGGNFLYLIRGNTTNSFYRYDILNNEWSTLVVLPSSARSGTDMKYIGNGAFAIMIAGTVDFYHFDVATNTFVGKASLPNTPNTYYSGSGFWFDGNDTLYAYFGGYGWVSAFRKTMAKYTISTDSWRILATPSVNMQFTENNLTSDGRGNLYIFGNDYMMNQNDYSMALKYNIASDTWETLKDFYSVTIRGTITSDNSRYIYIIPSMGNSRRIVRYDTIDNAYAPLGDVPKSLDRVRWDYWNSWEWYSGQATAMTYANNSIYVLGQNESTFSRFLRYDLDTKKTTYLPTPAYIAIGGTMKYLNDYIYYLPAGNRKFFYRYSFKTGDWEQLADAPDLIYRSGPSTMVADKNGNLLVPKGNSTVFYKYIPGTNTWSTIAAMPGAILNGSAVYDGDKYVYYLRSRGTNSFYRYDVDANTWATMANLPVTTDYGNSLVLQDGKIYATSGNWRLSMYVYDVLGNSWVQGTDSPEPFRYGGVLLKVDNDRAIGLAGESSPDIHQFNFPNSNASYQGFARHVSQSYQINGLFDYAGIQLQTTIPPNTKVEVSTRTSVDGNAWDNWLLADQIKQSSDSMSVRVASVPRKFIQIKIMLISYDNIASPMVDSYALSYYSDTDPPTNPTVNVPYSDNTKTTQITTNTWYNHARPYFDWPDPGEAGGATDGQLGSHIKGYWVYFGSDATALPKTAGVFRTTSDFEADLSLAGNYNLRIQAEDMTGNVDSNVFAPFSYRFDNVVPENPPFITVTPAGFTSFNSYTFVWPNAYDSHSGVSEYCYRTGATTGIYSTEQCQTEKSLASIEAAYLSGTNVLYLRTKDIAGNYSSSTLEVAYYYSTDPPSPVTNLSAIPPVSTQNLFAFSWELPALFSGDANQLTYCYSINELPSAINTTCTTDRFLSAFKAGTQKGTNIIYVVAKDEASNVNWNSYASKNFVANTVSPGIPLNLVVTDTSDRASSRWTLTMTWDKPTFEGNGIDHYIIERSEDGHTFDVLGTGSNTAYVDMNISSETVYYYRVRASDNVDNYGGASGIVSQQAKGRFITPPSIVSTPSARASFDRADISWVTSRASTSFVYYGTKPSDLGQSKGSLEIVTTHTINISGLLPQTVYYYKVQSFDQDRNYDLANSYSSIFSFRTSESAKVLDVNVTDIGLNTAIISWDTTVPTKAKIEYGKTTGYGLFMEEEGGFANSHFEKIIGLESGTLYHFRVNANTEYNSTVSSDDYTFTTIPYPTISNIRFQPLLDAPTLSVGIYWKTNVPTDSIVSYKNAGSSLEKAKSDLETEHNILLENLESNSEYSVTIKGRDRYGNLSQSDIQKWKSQIDTRVPKISDLNIDVSSTGSWGDSKAQLIISWATDEPASSQVRFGEGNNSALDKLTPLDTELTTNHVVVLSNISMGSIYKIQPISKDISGNSGYGEERIAVTQDKELSVLQVILGLFGIFIGD